MGKRLISPIKFIVPVLFIGLVFVLGAVLIGLPIIVFGTMLITLVIGGAYGLYKGVGWLSMAMGKPSLPHSIARSVEESRYYGRLIMQTAQQYPPGPMQDRLNLTIKPVEEWLARLAKLEASLAKLYSQRNLTRELRHANDEIEALHRQSLMSPDQEGVYLRALIESKKQHLAALKELQTFQAQAELKIRKIASDLATTHAEMLLLTAKGDFNDNRIHRLDENLQEHLVSLRDMLAAMDELGYSSSAV
jgi:hypothetical protein